MNPAISSVLGFTLSGLIPLISDLFGLNTILLKFITITSVLSALFALFMYYSYEYGLKYKNVKELLKKMEEIKKDIRNINIYNIFITLIGDFLVTISSKQFQGFDQQGTHNVDLAFELASFKEKEVIEKKNKILIDKKAISRIRRMRVLEICKSLLNNNINLFYATEFHLIEVIDEENGKWNNDGEYREALKDNENIKYCETKKRIIGISEKEYNNIRSNNNFNNFVSYLQWHIDNKWEAHLYIVKDELFPITLEKLGSINHECNELTDFIYVEYCHKRGKDKESVVFAQNDEGKCKYFKQPSSPVYNYKKLFESLLDFNNKTNSFKQSEHELVNNDLILKLRTNTNF